ncbi:MAG: L-threonylcarbamoyladenylate synthase [Desulfamplus sp.]|nr:L-threonylcarbamoyladenylate synthase [Desulfamplus sp.]
MDKVADVASLFASDQCFDLSESEHCFEIIKKAATIIHVGGVVVFPAKCLYGLAADALNPAAVQRVFEIKQRPLTNPLLVLIDDISQLDLLVKPVSENRSSFQSGEIQSEEIQSGLNGSPLKQKTNLHGHYDAPPNYENQGGIFMVKRYLTASALSLIEKFWPGNITLVFNAIDDLPKALTAGTGKIGIRMPGHPVARSLVRQVGSPITGTSANISGKAGCKEISMLDPDILSQIDMVLDSGILKGGIGSTVVDVTCDPVKIVREGEISRDEVIKAIRYCSKSAGSLKACND